MVLTGELVPAGFADGTDDGLLSVNWADLLGIPVDIADGDDVGMTAVTWVEVSGGYQRSVSGTYDWKAGSLFETQ